MIKQVVCDSCGSRLEYDDGSVWEGNRDMEDVDCPVCKNHIARIFTDRIVNVRVIKKGNLQV